MIKNIIFDIGRVLVDYDWRAYVHSYGFSPEKEAAIIHALFGRNVWQELDRGALTMDEIREAFVAGAPAYRDDILTVFNNSGSCIVRLDYAIPWICSLKERGYRIYYLSNYSAWMIEQTRAALDFLPYMNGGLFSYEAKLIKPEPEIYRALIDRCPQIVPEESVFLDDMEENVAAAKSFGMNGIVFRNKKQAEAELELLLS